MIRSMVEPASTVWLEGLETTSTMSTRHPMLSATPVVCWTACVRQLADTLWEQATEWSGSSWGLLDQEPATS